MSLTLEGPWSRRIIGIAPVSKTGAREGVWVRIPPAPLVLWHNDFYILGDAESRVVIGLSGLGNGVGNARRPHEGPK